GVIRMVESALVLGDEREALLARIEKQKARIIQFKNEVDDYNEKKKRWAAQVAELRLREQDLADARLEIDRLNAAMAPGKDEHKAAEGLTT
ncbi:hypothetical protein A2U01_0080837, partial [Trifolium medium]|nr:hypothetical protein [Trifolium medium]